MNHTHKDGNFPNVVEPANEIDSVRRFFVSLTNTLPYNYVRGFDFRYIDHGEFTQRNLVSFVYLCMIHVGNNSTLEASQFEYAHKFCNSMYDVKLWCYIIVMSIGIPGSAASAATMMSMERTPTTFYMTCLSVGSLLTILIREVLITSSNIDVLAFKELMTTIPLNTLTLMSFERFLALKYPLQKRRYYTVAVSKMTMGACIAYYFISFIITFIVHNTGKQDRAVVAFVIVILSYGLQMPLTLAFNYMTATSLKALAIQQQEKFATNKSVSIIDNSVIKIIVLSSTVYTLLNGPIIYVRLVRIASTEEMLEKIGYRRELVMIEVISEQATTVFQALTFFIYVWGTNRFRKQFKTLISESTIGTFFSKKFLPESRPSRQFRPPGSRSSRSSSQRSFDKQRSKTQLKTGESRTGIQGAAKRRSVDKGASGLMVNQSAIHSREACTNSTV